MKFDASTISAAKREEWACVEAACRLEWPAVGEPAMFNGRRMIWFHAGEIYVDGYVFAECKQMPPDATQAQITERVHKLLGKVHVVFDEDLPVAP